MADKVTGTFGPGEVESKPETKKVEPSLTLEQRIEKLEAEIKTKVSAHI